MQILKNDKKLANMGTENILSLAFLDNPQLNFVLLGISFSSKKIF